MVLATVISVISDHFEMKLLFRESLLVANTNHNHSARGFTLVELVIIITLLVILLAVGIPAYVNWMPDINLRSAIRNIKSDMELAKSTAIRENTSCALVFDTSTDPDSYLVFRDFDPTDLAYDDTTEETLIKRVSIPKNVTMTSAAFDVDIPTAVGFNSRGIPYTYDTVTSETKDLAGDGFVTLENTKNNHRRVRLTIVGLATIQRSADGSTWKDD